MVVTILVDMFTKRRRSLLEKARKKDCYIVCSATPQNVFYITGFWGDGTAVISEDGTTLFTNPLEGERAKRSVKDCDVIVSKIGESLKELVLRHVSSKGKLCFDDIQMPLQITIKKVLKDDVIFDPDIFHSVRRIKDEGEISVITQAGKIIDKLFSHVLTLIRPKVRERDLAAELLAKAVSFGCDLPAFPSTQNPIIVASGPNSAFPHGDLTERKLLEDDVVVIDIVVRFKGYIIDTTRTFALGRVQDEIKDVYEVVRSAQEEGINAVKPGATTGDVDKKVREIVDAKGYKQFFIHGTGHGVGLDVHEPPSLKIGGKEVLQNGETVTVEPGIYIPHKFGIRIEDTVLVSERTKSFTRFTKELLVLG
ncbi:MAG: aminopeptidase P family protein [Candidatus Methylarchaceae archaeon HK01B]|nr:aminopeptidase P family protein [Candidatus Methylarchaceae archaeon HK01B]